MWKLTTIDTAEIDFMDQGTGTPITFVHGGMAEECRAIVNEPALAAFRVIHFHRRGYGRSTSPEVPVSVERNAADCIALLNQRGVSRTHLVGQSMGGVIALQIVKDAPELVQSLTLLEPALPFLIPSVPDFGSRLEGAAKLYFAGDKVSAMKTFAAAVVGDTAPSEVLAQFHAEYFARWLEDAHVLFQSDLAALQCWTFAEDNLAEIEQPVLNIRGEHTPPFFGHVYLTLQKRLSHCESLIAPNLCMPIVLKNMPGLIPLKRTRHATGQQGDGPPSVAPLKSDYRN
jgi:pimeloyl-ACP methyl ester carboxylesterase